RIPLPEAADWCLLTVGEEGEPYRTVIAHVDAQKEAKARELLRRAPLNPHASKGPVQVIRSGQRQWTTADSVLLTVTAQKEIAELVRLLGNHSGVRLALVARGRTIGAMTLVRASAERPFTEQDLGFAEELAARGAMALDNATL